MLNHLVSIVNSEIKMIVSDAYKKIITDTTGFEGYVTENNSKFFEGILKRT